MTDVQNDGQKYIAIVNTVEDHAATLATTYTFSQLQFFHHVVRPALTCACRPMTAASQTVCHL